MTYQKQNFIDGETLLDAEIFNHIEDGIVAVETAAGNAATAASNAQEAATQAAAKADAATATANSAKSTAAAKQDKLVSGENIKTVNGQSLLGSGDIEIVGGGGGSSKTVDLIIFMGQSNMAGRGVAAEAPVVPEGHGYEFRAISDPTRLYPLAEPLRKKSARPR